MTAAGNAAIASLPSFERVCDALADLVLLIDERQTVRWANQAALELLGHRPESLAGQELEGLFADDDILSRVSIENIFVEDTFRDVGAVMRNSAGEAQVFTLSGRRISLPSGARGCVLIAKPAGAMQTLLAETSRWAAREKAKADALDAVARDVEIAQQIQTSMLPQSWAVPSLEIAATMRPSKVVGGDYYDVIPVEDGCWIGIGDVAGHGLQAGLIMLMIQSVVATVVRSRPDIPPSQALVLLNEVLYDNVRNRLGSDQHATLSLLRFYNDGRLVFAGAHEEMLVYRARTKTCEEIPTLGPWIATVPSIEGVVSDQKAQLEPGDLLVLHSDGVTEARNAAGAYFGLERLADVVARDGATAPRPFIESVLDVVDAWLVDQKDDITLLAMRFAPGPAAPSAPPGAR